jgi:hypothetical protein
VAGIDNAGMIVGVYLDGDTPFYRGFKLEDGVFTYPIDVPSPDPGPPTPRLMALAPKAPCSGGRLLKMVDTA